MIFRDRKQAAELLSEQLQEYRDKNPLILGIPRGSVPMAEIIASHLNGELDVVLVHKIGAPGNPEYAIGSVSEFGSIHQTDAVAFYGFSPEEVKRTAQAEIEKLKQRRASYSPVRSPISPKGRIVIIVDDGIATGSTMLAAIRAIRAQGPSRIVVAAPTAAPSSVEALKSEADEVIVVDMPEYFFSISQFYEDFPQVSDEEVFEALSAAAERAAQHRTQPPKRKAA